MLDIHDLSCSVEGKEILQSFSLQVNPGEVHAIMGPNGAGKSTLAKILAGHPAYQIQGGTVIFKGKDLLELEPDERAHLGLFMSFQYPIEIPGVSNFEFLFAAYNAKRKALMQKEATSEEFSSILEEKMAEMEIRREFKERNLNEGFSGGEKKRNEILQMAILDPDLAILDETDSGLDIDAMKKVASAVLQFMKKDKKKSLILITHYQRLLDYIRPDFVHVMMKGKLIKSGGPELAVILEKEGYDQWEGASQ